MDDRNEILKTTRSLSPEEREAYLVQRWPDEEQRERVRRLLCEEDAPTESMPSEREAAPVAPDYLEAEGSRVGSYTLLQRLGEGGFGVVWMAEQRKPISRMVALKIIKAGMDTRQILARFDAERQALAIMDHPNIARVIDAGSTEGGRPYFAMELVKGVPITRFCDEHKFGNLERLDLFVQVCSAINHAHQKGIIHRDIKPSNVLVSIADGQPVVKVIDFGIAKATLGKLTDRTLFTRVEQMIGTPVYMSPEQAALSGLDIDTRSDVYSLGVLLYEMLVGSPPFDHSTLLSAGYDEMRRIIREVDPPKPSSKISTTEGAERTALARTRRIEPTRIGHLIAPDLDWIIMKAIEKDRGRRYDTASALSSDVRRFLDSEIVEARPPSRAYRLQKFASKNRALVNFAVILMTLLVGGLVVVTILERNRAAEAAAAQLAAAEAAAARTVADQALEGTREQLREASRTAFSAAMRAWKEHRIEEAKGLRSVSLPGKNKWHEAVAHFARALEYDPQNRAAARWLYSTILHRWEENRDWPVTRMEDTLNLGWLIKSSKRPDGTLEVVTDYGVVVLLDSTTGASLADQLGSSRGQGLARKSLLLTADSNKRARLLDVAENEFIGPAVPHHEDREASQPANSWRRVFFSDAPGISKCPDPTRSLRWQDFDEPVLEDPIAGEPRSRVLPNYAGDHVAGLPYRPSFTADGSVLITYVSGSVHLWDTVTGLPLGPLLYPANDPNGFLDSGELGGLFSPDGDCLATGNSYFHDGTDSITQIWSLPNPHGFTNLRWQKVFADLDYKNGRLITEDGSGSWDWAERRLDAGAPPIRPIRYKALIRWGYPQSSVAGEIEGGFTGGILSRSLVAQGDSGKKIQLVDLISGGAIGPQITPNRYFDWIELSPDGRFVVMLDREHGLRRVDLTTMEFVDLSYPGRVPREFLGFDTAGERMAVGFGNSVSVLEVRGGELIVEFPQADALYFDPEGDGLIVAHEQSNQTEHLLTFRRHSAIGEPEGGGVRFKIDYNHWYSLSRSVIIGDRLFGPGLFLDLETGAVIQSPVASSGVFNNVVADTQRGLVFAGSTDGLVYPVDAFSGLLWCEPFRHPDSVCVLESGEALTTICRDGAIRDWELPVEAWHPEALDWVYAIAGIHFSPAGEMVPIGSKERLRTINESGIPPGPWRKLAEWVTTREHVRPVVPGSDRSIRSVATTERDFNTRESLESALRYDSTVPLTRLMLANHYDKLRDTDESRIDDPELPAKIAKAPFLRAYDLNLLPPGDPALRIRAARILSDAPEGATIGLGQETVKAKDEALRLARDALSLDPPLDEAQELIRKLNESGDRE